MQFLRRCKNAIYFSSATNTRLLGMNSAVVEKKNYIKTWQDIPGPSSLPIIGQLHHFLPGGSLYNLRHDLYETLYKKYGPIVKVKVLGVPFLVVHLYDADGIEEVDNIFIICERPYIPTYQLRYMGPSLLPYWT